MKLTDSQKDLLAAIIAFRPEEYNPAVVEDEFEKAWSHLDVDNDPNLYTGKFKLVFELHRDYEFEGKSYQARYVKDIECSDIDIAAELIRLYLSKHEKNFAYVFFDDNKIPMFNVNKDGDRFKVYGTHDFLAIIDGFKDRLEC